MSFSPESFSRSAFDYRAWSGLSLTGIPVLVAYVHEKNFAQSLDAKDFDAESDKDYGFPVPEKSFVTGARAKTFSVTV